MPVNEFLIDLFNPDLAFLPKALAVAVMSSIVCGVIGCHVVLRGMAFIGDAVAHAVFPGLAIAFALQGSLVLGGAAAGIATAVGVAVFSQNRRLKEDSVIGVFFVGAFALGVVIISQTPGYAGSLQQFLFGSMTGIPNRDLYVVGVTALGVLAVLFARHKELVAVALDREMAQAIGIPVFWLDLVLYVCVTLAVVISLQTIGNILVLALLVTPAATARLLTDRLGVMMFVSPLIGASAATLGLYLSWSYDLPVGATIVLVLTAAFLAAWLLAPRHGLVAKALRSASLPGRPALAALMFASVAAVPVVSAGSAQPADASGARRVLSTEHTDALHIEAGATGAISLRSRIGNAPSYEFAHPDDLIFQLVDSAATRRGAPSNPAYAFLGATGTPLWVAPQTQHPSRSVIWPGWDTEDIAAGTYQGDVVQMHLRDVQGPGAVEIYQVGSDGSPIRVLSSTDPGHASYTQLIGAHVHANWAFGAVGRYELTLEVTADPAGGGPTVSSGPITYVWWVGPVGEEPTATTTSTTTTSSTTVPLASTTTSTSVPAPTSTSTPAPPSTVPPSTAPSSTVPSPSTTTAVPPATCRGISTVLADGHVDLAARLVDGRLRTQVKDTTRGPSPVHWRDLASVAFRIPDRARSAVPAGAQWSFLGSAGRPLWLIPQTQQAGLLWAGWNTEDVDYGRLDGPVRWHLDQVEGPGDLAIYEFDSFGGATVVFDSKRPLPQSLDLAAPTHAHGNWAFTQPGTYRLHVRHSARTSGGANLASDGVLTVIVGDGEHSEQCPGADVPPVTDPLPGDGDSALHDDRNTGGANAAVAGGGGGATRARPAVCRQPARTRSTDGGATGSTASAGDAVVLGDGHVDYAARIEGGRLEARIKDGTVAGRTAWRDPSDVVLHLKAEAASTVPAGAGFSFIGAAGSPIWQVPQTQRPGILWLGWNTEEVGADQVDGAIGWTLDSVEGPGDVAVFEYDAFGAPQVLFNSADGTPDRTDVAIGTHAHGNWTFTAEGTYRLHLTYSATSPSGSFLSSRDVLTVVVGDVDPATALPKPQATPSSAAERAAAPAEASATSGVQPCPLPATGSAPGPLVRSGMALVLAGAAVLGLRRRSSRGRAVAS